MYSQLIRPMLFALDPEEAHHLMLWGAKRCNGNALAKHLVKALWAPPEDPCLSQTLLGAQFTHPVGLAAGFDKNAEILRALEALGFGFVEVGSISARPSPGNPRPRVFRLPEDMGVINRMGLNNEGVAVIASRLKQASACLPLGVSLSKTHDPAIVGPLALADYAQALQGVLGLGTYVSLNISCPNTREGKTFEDPEALEALLAHLRATETECLASGGGHSKPWLLKVSPDVSRDQLRELFDIGTRYQVAGWIATNTSRNRSGLKTPPDRLEAMGMGGLSGKPILESSTQVLGWLYDWGQALETPPVLIGVGGIVDGQSAWEKITHGASLLQVYTGLIYQGPGLLKAICKALRHHCEAAGFNHISQAVGSARK